jgi:hypothetical protein
MSSDSFFNHSYASFDSRDMAAGAANVDFDSKVVQIRLHFCNSSFAITIDS